MDTKQFIAKAKHIVAEYTNENIDKTNSTTYINEDNVFVVWSCKTLQNNKALLATTLLDGMYYEVTNNGARHEIYLDAYKKQFNTCIRW